MTLNRRLQKHRLQTWTLVLAKAVAPRLLCTGRQLLEKAGSRKRRTGPGTCQGDKEFMINSGSTQGFFTATFPFQSRATSAVMLDTMQHLNELMRGCLRVPICAASDVWHFHSVWEPPQLAHQTWLCSCVPLSPSHELMCPRFTSAVLRAGCHG